MTEQRNKALEAVEEAAHAAADRHHVVPRTMALRFAMAFLSNFTEDRVQLDGLWRAVTRPPRGDTLAEGFGRRQEITSCMNGLYCELGIKRRWEDRKSG